LIIGRRIDDFSLDYLMFDSTISVRFSFSQMDKEEFLSDLFAAGKWSFPLFYSDSFLSGFPFPIAPLPLSDPQQDHLLLLFFQILDGLAATNKLLPDTVMATLDNTNKTEMSIECALNFLRQFPETFTRFHGINATVSLILQMSESFG
jgi:hypothetical protein